MTIILIVLNLLLLVKLNYLQTILLGNTYLYDFDAYMTLLKESRLGVHPYQNDSMQTLGPPLVFSYFLPFSYLTIQLARSTAVFLNILSGLGINYLLAKKYFKGNINYFLVLNLLLFSAFPTRFGLESGQPILLLAFLLTILLTTTNNLLKYIAFSLIVGIKTHFLLIITSLLRSPKLVFKMMIALAIFSVFTLIFIPFDWYVYFLTNKTESLFYEMPITNLDYYNQTIFRSVSRLGLPAFGIEIQMIISLLIFAISTIFSSLPLAIIGSLLVAPVYWQHYTAIIFPILVISASKMNKSYERFLLATSFILFWIEIPFLHDADATFVNRLLASHYLYSVLILSLLLIGRNINRSER